MGAPSGSDSCCFVRCPGLPALTEPQVTHCHSPAPVRWLETRKVRLDFESLVLAEALRIHAILCKISRPCC